MNLPLVRDLLILAALAFMAGYLVRMFQEE